MKIPFSPPFIDRDVEEEVLDTLRSGWITTGPKVALLEREISSLCEVNNVICTNSATSSLLLCLHWFGVSEGDEVIIPAYTYAATALAVIHLGATPIIVDVLDDYRINPEEVYNAITPSTKAIIAVDFGGWPCDYDAIYNSVQSRANCFRPSTVEQEELQRPLILADAAHSIGASYKKVKVGRCADLSAFSFHAVKNITSAEGGAVCVNLPPPFDNDHIEALFRLLTLNGQSKDALAKSSGNWEYDILMLGFKANMPDICASIALAQIRKYQSLILPERKRVFNTYFRLLGNRQYLSLPTFDDHVYQGSCHLFPIRIPESMQSKRNQLIESARLRGIAFNVHFKPLNMLTAFKPYTSDDSIPIVANRLFASSISLPVYPTLTIDNCIEVSNVFPDFIS